MSARRWPVITLGLILLNFAIFLGTHRVIEKQEAQLWQTRTHILILAAMHPQLLLTPVLVNFRNRVRCDMAVRTIAWQYCTEETPPPNVFIVPRPQNQTSDGLDGETPKGTSTLWVRLHKLKFCLAWEKHCTFRDNRLLACGLRRHEGVALTLDHCPQTKLGSSRHRLAR
jgi:hypothetical protein